MRKRIITISREFGSGGHTIGKAVAEKLGITFYDQELLEHIAEETGFSREFIESAAEDSTANHSLLFNMVVNRSLQLRNEPTPADMIFFTQMEIIRKIAEKEECVIVGRCSDYILRERKDCLNVFIYADEKDREKRILQRYGENEKPVKKRIADKDSRRKTYYSHYTDRLWGIPQNYHICLNSSVLGEESCIDIICRIFREVGNETT
ncbi:MAG: cytidylate kinase-like family protein [Lachnospiraceae bacterium]|nr:cytidylate kinase-like family protein [Lachnospiraceae bacterium]